MRAAYFFLMGLSLCMNCGREQSSIAIDTTPFEEPPQTITILHRAASFATIRWDGLPWHTLDSASAKGEFEIPIAGTEFDYVDVFTDPTSGGHSVVAIRALASDFSTWDMTGTNTARERIDFQTNVVNLDGNVTWVNTVPKDAGYNNHFSTNNAATLAHRPIWGISDVEVWDLVSYSPTVLGLKILHNVDFRQQSPLTVDMADAPELQCDPMAVQWPAPGPPPGVDVAISQWTVLTANGTLGPPFSDFYCRVPKSDEERGLFVGKITGSQSGRYNWEITAEQQLATDLEFEPQEMEALLANAGVISKNLRIDPNTKGRAVGVSSPQCHDLSVAYYRSAITYGQDRENAVDTIVTPGWLGERTRIEHTPFDAIPGFPNEILPAPGQEVHPSMFARCTPPTKLVDPQPTGQPAAYYDRQLTDYLARRPSGWRALRIAQYFNRAQW